MSPVSDLAGKVVVVTGAAQGIGAGYARNLAGEGCAVVATDVNEKGGQSLVDDIQAGGGKALFQRLDVADDASCQELAGILADQFGRVDGLVNNAAIFSSIQMKPFWEITTEEWDRLMAVNLRGPWQVTKALLPLLKASGAASVVNVASDAVLLGRPGYLHYVASKGGVAGMTNSMARELGPFGIRVNSISPGPVYTEVERGTVTEEQKQAMLGAQALKRHASPDDMIGVVAFLLSASSGWVTGQSLSVNGGLAHR